MKHTLSRRLYRKVRNLPAETVLRAPNFSPVESRLKANYSRAIALHKAKLPILSAEDRQIVDNLNRDGIHIPSLANLGLAGS